MSNIIKHKRSDISGLVPGTGSIDQAELAINIFDGKLYTKNINNSIINLGVSSISGTNITPNSGNFTNSLRLNNSGVSVTGHSHSISDITNLQTALDSKQSSLTNPVTGTGIASHIAYWNSSSGIIADSGQLYWDATNNRLGVGISSPVTSTHFRGTLTVDAAGQSVNNNSEGIRLSSASNGYSLIAFGVNSALSGGTQANQWWIGKDGTNNGFNFNNGNDRLHISSSGKVGIGTNAPRSNLHVLGSGQFSDTLC
jgi:hypothetical protein